MVKGGVETGHLGQVGKASLKRFDQQDSFGQVFRVEGRELAHVLDQFLGDQLWLAVLGSAMHDAMPDRR